MVLTENASQVAAGEENRAGAVMALETGLFAEMRSDCVHDDIGPYQTMSSLFKPVHRAQTRTEIAVRQVSISCAALLGRVGRA